MSAFDQGGFGAGEGFGQRLDGGLGFVGRHFGAGQEQGDVTAARVQFPGQLKERFFPVGRAAKDIFAAQTQVVAGVSGFALADGA